MTGDRRPVTRPNIVATKYLLTLPVDLQDVYELIIAQIDHYCRNGFASSNGLGADRQFDV
jgi:hypothetical protein